MITKLDPAQYWKLRAFCTETQRCNDALLTATKRQTAMLAELGLDPTTPNFSLNDDTYELNIPDANGEK